MKQYQVITIKGGKMVREIRKVEPEKKTFKQRLLKFFGLQAESFETIAWYFGALSLGIIGMIVIGFFLFIVSAI